MLLRPVAHPRLESLDDRIVPTARVQVINDLVPLTGTRFPVDVYIDDVRVADDLPPGDGTPFLTIPSGVPVKIVVAHESDFFGIQPITTLTRTFAADSTAVAIGVEQLLPPRPPQPLSLTDTAREAAADPERVDLLVFSGTEGIPPVDVRLVGFGRVADDLPFGGFTEYRSVPPGKYALEVFRADGMIRFEAYTLDLTAAAGKAAVLALGGSLGGPSAVYPVGIDPSVVFADGSSTGSLPTAKEARFAASGAGVAGMYSQTGVSLFDQNLPRPVGMSVTAADVTGDGVLDLVGAHGPGLPQNVYAIDGQTKETVFTLGTVFEPSFTRGLFVAAGDFNDDGIADLVITPDQGGSGRVQVVNGKDRSVMADFFGIEDVNFRGGARAAVGDVNGDGVPDLIVAAGFRGGPRVALFDGSDLRPGSTPRKLVGDFFVFENTLRNGAFVGSGDFNADGKSDPVFGGGPGGGPRVLAINGADLVATGARNLLTNFFAGDVNNRGGVRVAARYLDDDDRADLLVGLGQVGEPQVRTFLGKDLGSGTPALEVSPFPEVEGDAVFVG